MSSLARMIDFTATALFLSQFLHSLINNLREDGIQKGEKRGMANAKMYTFLEQNIVARFVCINEYGHRLTFGIFYYVKYYDRIEIQCGAFFHTLIKYINCI